MSVALESTPFLKLKTKPHLGLVWHIFHILNGEDIDDFAGIKFVSQIVLKFVDVP